MKRLKLTIELGNDAMQTGADVARALRDVADSLHSQCEYDPPPIGWRTLAYDLNGNRVGDARVTR